VTARKPAQPGPVKWRSQLDDPRTFERIDTLLGALSRNPDRYNRYELSAPQEERDLIILYAARGRPKDAARGIRHFVACMLSLSWQFPEHYGPTAPSTREERAAALLRLGTAPRFAPE
jgi:hypothetical protein